VYIVTSDLQVCSDMAPVNPAAAQNAPKYSCTAQQNPLSPDEIPQAG